MSRIFTPWFGDVVVMGVQSLVVIPPARLSPARVLQRRYLGSVYVISGTRADVTSG